MKYFFTTLAINEPYFEKSLKFHQDMHERTEDGYFNITTTLEDFNRFERNVGLTYDEFKIKYPRIYITFVEKLLPRYGEFKFPLDMDGYGFIFNLNLKSLSIKACLNSGLDFSHLIFCDGDWNIYDEFSENKIKDYCNQMDNMGIDFAFERPAKIGNYKSNNYQDCFFMEKLLDYQVTDHSLWDEAEIVNEQILGFRNNWKLKVFAMKWEQWTWYSIANNIRNYPDGFEIGVSALESQMTMGIHMFVPMRNCFWFQAKYSDYKYIKF